MQDTDASLHRPALESLRVLIRSSTTSMTSVPKPLKFLRARMDDIKAAYEAMALSETKVPLHFKERTSSLTFCRCFA
jgi:26S proteasome regulatory subunit N1